MSKTAAILLAVTATVAPQADLHAAYTFTNIYSGSRGTTIFAYDISGSTVAVHTEGIFKVTGGVTTSIVKSGDAAPVGTFAPYSLGTLPNLSLSGGTASFSADYGGGSGVFHGSGGPLTTIASLGDATTEGAITDFPYGVPTSISGANVAFMASTASGEGIYVGNGGLVKTIVNTGDAAPTGAFTNVNSAFSTLEILGPRISGDRVAFIGDYPQGRGIFTGNGGALTTIVKTGDAAPSGTWISSAFRRHVISGDAVAFSAGYTGGLGIFVGNGGPLTTIVKTGDPAPGGVFTSLTIGGIANNGADVSFGGAWSGGSGAFVSKGGTIETVIKTGDLLFGQTMTGLGQTFPPINHVGLDPDGSGNLVFSYRLADGTSGVAMATPVPEPSTLALAAATLALIPRRRRTR